MVLFPEPLCPWQGQSVVTNKARPPTYYQGRDFASGDFERKVVQNCSAGTGRVSKGDAVKLHKPGNLGGLFARVVERIYRRLPIDEFEQLGSGRGCSCKFDRVRGQHRDLDGADDHG